MPIKFFLINKTTKLLICSYHISWLLLCFKMNKAVCLLFLAVLIPDIYALGETCTNKTDCAVKRSVCYENKCICDDLSYDNEGGICYPYATTYKDTCFEDKQCTIFHESLKCTNNKCVCEKGFRWFLSECKKYVGYGEDCEIDEDCFNGYDLLAMKCNAKKCDCSDTHYFRNPDCRPKTDENLLCALNIDCLKYDAKTPICSATAQCVAEKTLDIEEKISPVTSKAKVFYSSPIEETDCTTDADCSDIPNSACQKTKCVCNNGYFFSKNTCIPGFGYCSDVSHDNTMCINGVSVCKPGYFYNEETNECSGELGIADCKNAAIKPNQCVNEKTYCPVLYFSDDTNRECFKTMRQSNQACVSNQWCRALGPYSICNSGTCACISAAELNKETMYCELKSGDDLECISSDDCGMYKDCVEGKCQCGDNYIPGEDDECLPKYDGTCQYQNCIENLSCVQEKCTCDVVATNHSMCLEGADLGDPCEIKEQCTYTSNKLTCENNICDCVTDYVALNGACVPDKSYNSMCSNQKECTQVLGDQFQCRNSLCQCAIGRKYVDGKCVSSSGKLLFSISLIMVTLLMMKIV